MPSIKVPLLKVHAFPDGRIVPCSHYRESPIQPSDDAWWENVLTDARAGRGSMPTSVSEESPIAFYRLDHLRGATFRVECICGLSGNFNKGELIRNIGGDAHINWLATKMLDCGRKNKIGNYCRAHCVR